MKRRILSLLMVVCMLTTMLTPVAGTFATSETNNNSSLSSVSTLSTTEDEASVPAAAAEKTDWAALAAEVELTGNWRDDLIAIAESQLGYHEENGVSLYGEWAERPTADWTAHFINWVATQAGLTKKQFPHGNTYKYLRIEMNDVGALKRVSRYNYPSYGDLALIEADGQQLVGIVAFISNGYASVIHGDDNGAVTQKSYKVETAEFDYYVDLNVLMERAGIDTGKGGSVPVIPADGVVAWTNTNAVYVRQQPTTQSQRITTVKKSGTPVTVTSAQMCDDGYIWYGIEYEGKVGYIRGDLLTLDKQAIPTATPKPTKAPSNGNNTKPTAAPTAAPEAEQPVVTTAPAAPTLVPSMGGVVTQDRVVNIDVVAAEDGETVNITFDIYGATAYQWYEVKTVAGTDGDTVTTTPVEGATTETLAVVAKAETGVTYSYYCVATIEANGQQTQVTSKTTVLNVGAPIHAVAILGEEINFSFTYENENVAGYQWYVIPVGQTAGQRVSGDAFTGADTYKLTFAATAEYAGAQFYCVAKSSSGEHLKKSSVYTYEINTAYGDLTYDELSAYVHELAHMSPKARYNAINTTWAEAGLGAAVVSFYHANFADVYPELLCDCDAGLTTKPGDKHDTACSWYVYEAPAGSTGGFGLEIFYDCDTFAEECEILNSWITRKASPKEIFNTLMELKLNPGTTADGFEYDRCFAILMHVAAHPQAEALICNCWTLDENNDVIIYAPSADHAEDCPWHVDMAEVDGSIVGLAINVTGSAFPAGTTMTADAVASEETLAAIDAAIFELLVDENGNYKPFAVLDAFDIAFTSNGEKVQPAAGNPVGLAFTVPTSALTETYEDGTTETAETLSVYHLIANADGTYTAELVGNAAVDAAAETQSITVEAKQFSIYVVAGGTETEVTTSTIGLEVGESITLRTDRTGSSWSPSSGNDAFDVVTNGQSVTVTAKAEGQITLTYGNSYFNRDRITITSMTYTLTFQPNGGNGSAATMKTAAGGYFAFPTPESLGITPANENMLFVGWSTDSAGDGDNYIANIQGSVTQNTTYYAIWINTASTTGVNAYFHIRLDGVAPYEPSVHEVNDYTSRHGLTGTLRNAVAVNNDLDAVAANILTPPTREQINSRLRSDGKAELTATQEVLWYVIKWNPSDLGHSGSDWHVDGIIKEIDDHMVIYDPNGGDSNVPGRMAYTPGKEYTIDFTTIPNRQGWVFLGWDEDAGATDPEYDLGGNYTEIMPDHDVILYAIWQPSNATPYKVEHYLCDMNEGNPVLADTENLYGTTDSTVTAQPKTYAGYELFTKEGYTKASGVVAADGSLVLKLYYKQMVNNLTITKEFVDVPMSAVPADTTITVNYAGPVSGSVQLSAANNWTVTVPDIPVGEYTVTEPAAPSIPNYDFVSTAYNNGSEAVNTVELTKTQAGSVKVVNTYARQTSSLTITKQVQGVADADLAGVKFSFTVTNNYDGEVRTIELANGETYTFNGLPVATYTVTEAQKVIANYDFVSTTYNGSETVNTVELTKEKAGTVVVVNTYARQTSSLTITKQVQGVADADLAGVKFSFTVTNNYDGTEQTVTLPQNGEWTVKLENLPVATYTVTEGTVPVITNYVFVPEQSTITATAEVKKDSVATATIVNTYKLDVGPLTITKVVVDETGYKYNETYSFKVTLMDAEGKAVSGTFPVEGLTGVENLVVTDGVGTLTGVPAGKIVIKNIVIGTVFTVTETNLQDHYTVTYAGNEGTIATADGAQVTVTNTYRTGSLVITKKVDGAANPPAQEFTVKVALPDGEYPYTNSNGSNGTLTVKDDAGQLTIAAGETITITGIKIGSEYSVEETDYPVYFQPTYSNATGEITSAESKVEITNTYLTGTLTITKTVTGVDNDDLTDVEFSFTVLNKKGEKVAEVSLPQEGKWSVDIPNLPVGEYTVTEAETPIENYTQTAVTANTDNGATTTVTVESDETAVAAFVNEYTKNTANLIVTKKVVAAVTGTSAPEDDTFTIRVTFTPKAGSAYRLPTQYRLDDGDPQSLTLVKDEDTDDSWYVDIPNVKDGTVITILGLYIDTQYEVEETDAPAYYVASYSDNCTGTIVKENVDTEVINTYHAGSLTITKTVAGVDADDIPTGEVYTFQIMQGDKQIGEIITLAAGENETITNLPVGEYTVQEVLTDGKAQAIADYTFVKVTANNADSASATVTVESGKTAVAAFVNEYTKNTKQLQITKQVEGTPLVGDDFTVRVTFTPKANSGYDEDSLPQKYTLNGVEQTITYTKMADAESWYVDVTMKATEVAVFPGVVIDTQYHVEEINVPEYYQAAYTNCSGTIAETDIAAVVTNTYLTGSLTVTKTVVNNTIYDVSNQEFTFAVKLTHEKTGLLPETISYKVGEAVRTAPVANGVYTITLKGGESAVFTGLPYGTTYEVVETPVVAGYVTTYVNENRGTVEATTPAPVVEVKNEYKVGTLTITKTIDGEKSNSGDTFLFRVTGEGVNLQVLVPAGGTVTIQQLPVGEYTVTEIESWSWRYDCTDADATMTATITLEKLTASVTFTNEVIHDYWLDGSDYTMNQFTVTK